MVRKLIILTLISVSLNSCLGLYCSSIARVDNSVCGKFGK